MKKKSALITALALALVLVGALAGYTYLSRGESAPQFGLAEGAGEVSSPAPGEGTPAPTPMPAPDFTVYDAGGNAVSFAELMGGKPTVLNFWASWCGPCRSEMPHFQEAYERLGGEVNFVMVNMTDGQRETQESAAEYVSESGWTFPVYFDRDLDAAITYGAYSLPQTYLINAEGRLVAGAAGAMSAEMLQTGLDMIM